MVVWEICKIPPWWSLVVYFTCWLFEPGKDSHLGHKFKFRKGLVVGSTPQLVTVRSTIKRSFERNTLFNSIHFYEGADTDLHFQLVTGWGICPKDWGSSYCLHSRIHFRLAPAKGGFPQGSLAPEGLRFQFQHALSVAVVSVKDLDLFRSEDQWMYFIILGPAETLEKQLDNADS